MSFGRKAAIAVAAFATVGSTLFGGAALAGDDHGNGDHPRKDDKKKVSVWKGGDAKGGDVSNSCNLTVNPPAEENDEMGRGLLSLGLLNGLTIGGPGQDRDRGDGNGNKVICKDVGGDAYGGGFGD